MAYDAETREAANEQIMELQEQVRRLETDIEELLDRIETVQKFNLRLIDRMEKIADLAY